jgi:hypothetical protein
MQHRDGLELLRSRVSMIRYAVAIVLSVLVFGFWQLQVVQKSHYADLAEKNRIKEIRLVAPRGKISPQVSQDSRDNRPHNIVYSREYPHGRRRLSRRCSDSVCPRRKPLRRLTRKDLITPAEAAEPGMLCWLMRMSCLKSAWNFSLASIARGRLRPMPRGIKVTEAYRISDRSPDWSECGLELAPPPSFEVSTAPATSS